LELQAISRLALLFGTTWITSAVVISSILVMILASNLIVITLQEKLSKMLTPLYVILLISLVTSYFLQVDQVLSWNSEALGKSLVTLVTLFPMFIAGLIFPVSFAKHKDSATAFAFNLCGSTIGALLEYQANFTGINSLILVSAGLYLLSYFALHAKDKAGRSLIEPDAAPSTASAADTSGNA
jgi:hypothetical protein